MRILFCSNSIVGREMLYDMYSIATDKDFYVTYIEDKEIVSYPDYDIGISFLYTHKIPRAQVETHQWYNFHPGPLPEMRGRNLAYHAIANGLQMFGATLHYMSADYDTGDIIECRRFPILDSDNAGDLVKKSHAVLSDMFIDYIPRIVSGEDIKATPQDAGHYYKKDYIDNEIMLTDEQQRTVRAVTVPGRFYAVTNIGGVEYQLIPQEHDV